MAKRVRTVEREPGWGWIARDPAGYEVTPDFRWASREIARGVAREAARTFSPILPPYFGA